MAKKRIKISSDKAPALYNITSNFVLGEFRIVESCKVKLHELFHGYAEATGCCILTYSFLNNHFHVLAEVPKRPEQRPDDEALFRPFERLRGKRWVESTLKRLAKWTRDGREDEAEKFREHIWRWKYDLSKFVGGTKQCFTQWFNAKYENDGTIWKSRFHSELAEGRHEAAGHMAAYDDMNPVRAGIVEHPADYVWCGYGAAVRKDPDARAGITRLISWITGHRRQVLSGENPAPLSPEVCFQEYTKILEGYGSNPGGTDESGKNLKRVIRKSSEIVELIQAVEAGKILSLDESVRLEMGYLTHGWALGSREFLKELVKNNPGVVDVPEHWEPHRVKGLKEELYVLRHFAKVQIKATRQEPKENSDPDGTDKPPT